jgi:hypothetical protein
MIKLKPMLPEGRVQGPAQIRQFLQWADIHKGDDSQKHVDQTKRIISNISSDNLESIYKRFNEISPVPRHMKPYCDLIQIELKKRNDTSKNETISELKKKA